MATIVFHILYIVLVFFLHKFPLMETSPMFSGIVFWKLESAKYLRNGHGASSKLFTMTRL